MLGAPERFVPPDRHRLTRFTTSDDSGSMAPHRRYRRVGAVAVGAALLFALTPGEVAADPAGPSDYRSEVTALEPPSDAVRAEIVGGDSFVLLDVAIGTEVTVFGYDAEPYLEFRADGSIWENQRSPATYYNRERYGAPIPAEADAGAEPVWYQVGTGGSWAWHDHRAHRMETFAPLNAARGDQILDAEVPILIDGQPATIAISGFWAPEPSPVPGILGLFGALVAVVVIAHRTRTWYPYALWTALVAFAAAFVGTAQFVSLPPSTAPRLIWWALPVAAAIIVAVAMILGRGEARRIGFERLWGPGAVAVAGAQLLMWGIERRHGLVRAVLATDLAPMVDRFVTAAAIGTGIGAIAVSASMILDIGPFARRDRAARIAGPVR